MERAEQTKQKTNEHNALDGLQSYGLPTDTLYADPRFSVLKGKYSILEKIGHGAQGNVYKAKDTSGNIVAIKVFDLHDAPDWKAVELFKREVETLKSLSIDGIPKYIDFIDANPYFFLVESYISAKSLQDYIEKGFRATDHQVYCILIKTLTILNELHNQRVPIIHRDIKPGNILVEFVNNDDVDVWVVDMGTVTSLRQSSHASTIAGTSGYAAPEQLMGNAVPASDLYALGMTIVHLLSGVAPWNMEMNGLSVQFEKYLPVNLSASLKSILLDMLRPDPSARIQTAKTALSRLTHTNNRTATSQHDSSKPITIEMIKELHEATQIGIKECRDVLYICDGDIDSALNYILQAHADDPAIQSHKSNLSYADYKSNKPIATISTAYESTKANEPTKTTESTKNSFSPRAIFLTCLPLAVAIAGIIMFFIAPEFDLMTFIGALFAIIFAIVITGAQPLGLAIISILTISVCFNVSTLMGIGILLTITGLFGAFVAFGHFAKPS